jgi:hypothetical protein
MQQSQAQKPIPNSPNFTIDITPEDLSLGLYQLMDDSEAPLGSARVMQNMMITDRGGLAPRPGTQVLGTYDSTNKPLDGVYNYVKSNETLEIPMKASNGTLKYYHPTILDWVPLKSGFTAGNEFGFKESLVNTDNEDYLYFCNRTENYQRWSGMVDVTTIGLVGSETTLTIGSTLKTDIYAQGTSTTSSFPSTAIDNGATSTTIKQSVNFWTANQWVGFIVTMTSGSQAGQTGQITGNTTNELFFTAMAGAPANGDTYTITTTATSRLTTLVDTSEINSFYTLWTTGQWINFYVEITSGPKTGSISLITATTNQSITFASLGGDPGAGCTYQIRLARFPVTGNLVVNGNLIAYSAIPSPTTFTITAPGMAVPVGSAVTIQPIEYPGAPKGNRLELNYTRMIVGNVRTGVSRDANGNIQGSLSGSSWYYSAGGISSNADPTNFGFSATRVAGEGGIESVPYGGGNINDIANQESEFYVFKRDYIEADDFTQDANDIPQRVQLKTGFGSINKVTKGKDDIYFVTQDNQITSVRRVKLADTLPQSVNIGINIKRLLDTFDFTETHGIEFKNRLLFASKSSPDNTYNDQIIVYNERTKSFEGVWQIGTSGFFKSNNQLFYGEAAGANVWEMFTGYNDERTDTQQLGVTSQWRTNWFHLVPRKLRSFRVVPSKFETVALFSIACEGFILDGTSTTISVFTDYSDLAALSFDFGNTDADNQFKQGLTLDAFLGANPLGLAPLGTISDPDGDGLRHFMFIIYFPYIYANYMSLGLDTTGKNQYSEFTRFSLGSTEDSMRKSINIKSL